MNRSFWPLAIWFFFQSAVFFSFGGLWGGPYLSQVYGLDRSAAGQILSLLAVGLICGGPLQSVLSNRLFKGRKPTLILSSLVTLGITITLVLNIDSLTLAGLSGICFLFGAFTSASVVVGFSSAKELYPVGMAGTAIGLINLFPFAGGAVFQPFLGWVLERGYSSPAGFSADGYQMAFLVLVGCAAVAVAGSFAVRETFPARIDQ